MGIVSKVVHLTSVHPPFDTRIFYKECQTLVGAGYEVVLIAPTESDAVVDGVRIRAVPVAKNRLTRITRTRWQVYRTAVAERADVYHFHDPELIGVGLLLRATTRTPVIYDVHEHNPDAIRCRHWIPAPLRSLLAWLFDRWEVLIGRCFSAIVTADGQVTRRFQRCNSRVLTLFNFPLRELYVYGEERNRRRILDGNRVVLAYVGVMGRDRGLLLMLEAIEILVKQLAVNAELVLAGRIHNSEEREEFESYVNRSPLLSGRVNWLGLIPQSQVPSVLADADIGWVPLASIPKFHKNIPTKMFEYMASGMPVVGSDLPPIRRFVEDAQAGRLAVPDSARSHAEQVAYLVHNPDVARRMGKNARQAFETRYHWGSEAKKLIKLYCDLVPQSRNSRRA